MKWIPYFDISLVTLGSKIPDKLLPAKWTLDDREQLKKYIMMFGYGRWKEIQEASRHGGGRLKDKTIPEIRAFANSFIQCISMIDTSF